jgi:hypothetical protein
LQDRLVRELAEVARAVDEPRTSATGTRRCSLPACTIICVPSTSTKVPAIDLVRGGQDFFAFGQRQHAVATVSSVTEDVHEHVPAL